MSKIKEVEDFVVDYLSKKGVLEDRRYLYSIWKYERDSKEIENEVVKKFDDYTFDLFKKIKLKQLEYIHAVERSIESTYRLLSELIKSKVEKDIKYVDRIDLVIRTCYELKDEFKSLYDSFEIEANHVKDVNRILNHFCYLRYELFLV